MNLARLWAIKILNRLSGKREEQGVDQLKEDAALRHLFQRIQSEITLDRLQATDEKEWDRFQQKYHLSVSRSDFRIRPYLWAVCAFFVLGIGISLFFWLQREKSQPFPAHFMEDIILTTESGEAYSLEKVQPTRWIQKHQIEIKEDGREMSYANQALATLPQEWHTIRVPAQKGYTVILADGTKIILNAHSSLRYPSRFVDSVREVWLEGEAYFEVAHQDRHPFVVHFQENKLTVLGTTFNVYCPPGEISRTTLISGSVSLDNNRESRLLHPGEEGIIEAGRPEIVLQKVDVEEALAWTRNMFYFKNRTLEEIVKRLSDWYGLNILFQEEELRNLVLTLESIRYDDIETVLKIIKTIGNIDYVLYGETILLRRQE